MTVDQMDSEDVVGIVSDKDGGEVLDMFVFDRWLVTVIAQGIVSKREIVCQLTNIIQQQEILTARGSPESFEPPAPYQGLEGWGSEQGESPCPGW